jgi:hypothetical protein
MCALNIGLVCGSGMCDPGSRISLVASTCRSVLVPNQRWRLQVFLNGGWRGTVTHLNTRSAQVWVEGVLCLMSEDGGMCDPRSRMSRVASTCRSVLVLSQKCRLCGGRGGGVRENVDGVSLAFCQGVLIFWGWMVIFVTPAPACHGLQNAWACACTEPQVAPADRYNCGGGRGGGHSKIQMCTSKLAQPLMCDPRSRISLVASTCRSVLVLSHRCRLCMDTRRGRGAGKGGGGYGRGRQGYRLRSCKVS